MTRTIESPAGDSETVASRVADARSASGETAADTAGPARTSVARLGLMIGGRRLLVDLAEAGEIVPMPPVVVPVPLTREWFLGVTNLRGSLFTVVDLRRFNGEGPTELTKESRLLSLAPTLNFNATLIVSRMLGLRNTASMTPLPPEGPGYPGDGAGPADWLGERFADADGQVWQELSLSRLAATPEFLMVGR